MIYREQQLKIQNKHLLDRKHPQHIIDYVVLQKYFSQNFIQKIIIALHLSEPTILTIILILKKSAAA